MIATLLMILKIMGLIILILIATGSIIFLCVFIKLMIQGIIESRRK